MEHSKAESSSASLRLSPSLPRFHPCLRSLSGYDPTLLCPLKTTKTWERSRTIPGGIDVGSCDVGSVLVIAIDKDERFFLTETQQIPPPPPPPKLKQSHMAAHVLRPRPAVALCPLLRLVGPSALPGSRAAPLEINPIRKTASVGLLAGVTSHLTRRARG